VTAEQAGLGPSAATVTLMLGGDAGAREIVYRVGGQKDQSYYVQRDGVDTIYLVSQWIGGRLTSGVDDLIKKDTPPPADPHGGIPGMPQGMPPGMPPGMPGNVVQMQPPQ
jgi:hypothetical protein